MISAFICFLPVCEPALPAVTGYQSVAVKIVATNPADDNVKLNQELTDQAQRWAVRYLEVHKSSGVAGNIQVELHMPFELPTGVSPREVQFRHSQFLSGEVSVAGQKEIPFSLEYREGQWTRDARYRRANSMDTVLRAYVRKAVDKALGLALTR